MTRKDIIIVAALVNAGLLAILFMMAINSDDDKISDAVEVVQPIAQSQPTEVPFENNSAMVMSNSSHDDEIDHALQEFATTTPKQTSDEETFDSDDEVQPSKVVVKNKDKDKPTTASKEKPFTSTDTVVQVTVKRGDSLEKIARANGTTISAIKEVNQLKSDRLNIGQVLRIPIAKGEKKVAETAAAKPAVKATESKPIASTATNKPASPNDSQYYTVQSGDNPWKIAKQFHMKVDELLELNNLDEEKARKMKIGDKIRVR